MGKINVGRLIMGGIVAGIAIDIVDYFVDGIWLAQRWAAGMALLGHPGFTQMQIILFNVIGLLTGIVAIWVYAAIRPRFGAASRRQSLPGWRFGCYQPCSRTSPSCTLCTYSRIT